MKLAVDHHEVEQFRALVTDRLGLFFDDSKLGILTDALCRRAEANNVSVRHFLKRLAAPGCLAAELRQLAQELTVTETYFYRSADQLQALVKTVLPQCLAKRADSSPVRILSAGCASGDEPYSLAIAIREHLVEAAADVSILAVDVNPAMLEKARSARYSNWSLRGLPASLRQHWFRADGADFVLDAAIRRAVVFQERNLVQDDPEIWRAQSCDIVFCRNVLMYFDPALVQTLVARIARSLVPGGFLFLGHAETLRGLSHDFHLCHTHGTFYYRRKEGETIATALDVAAPEGRAAVLRAVSRVDDAATWVDKVQHASDRIRALADISHELSRPPTQAVPDRPAAELHRTLELLRSERFEQVLAELDTLPAAQAREPEVLLLRAVSLTHSGALEQAEAVCRELLACDELNAGAHYVLALCREGRGDIEGAIEENLVAVYLDPGFAMARLRLGLLARRRGERERARRELAQALLSLQQEDASRLLLFGGGFKRDALVTLCRAELAACRERS